MDVCDPNASIKELREAVRRNTGLDDVKLSREQICDIKSRVEGGLILAPPLMLSADRKFMRDPKSPFTRLDYEKLFSAETKRPTLVRLAKKIRVAINEESATKEQIIDAIHSKLRLMKISEPIELAKRSKKRRRRTVRPSIDPMNSAMENNNRPTPAPPKVNNNRPTPAPPQRVNNNNNNRPTPTPPPPRVNNNNNNRPTPPQRVNNNRPPVVQRMNNRPQRFVNTRPRGKSFFERIFGGGRVDASQSFEENSRRLRNAKRQMNARENAFERQKRETQRKMNNIRDAAAKIKRERDRYDDELKYLRRQQYSSAAERKAKEQQIALVQQKLKNSEIKLEMSEKSKDSLEAELKKQETQIKEANKKIDEEKRKMQEHIKQSEAEIKRLQEQLRKGVEDPKVKEEYESKLSKLTATFKEQIATIGEERNAERKEAQAKIDKLRGELEKAQDPTEKKQLQEQLSAMEMRVQEVLKTSEAKERKLRETLKQAEETRNERKELEQARKAEAETKLTQLANDGKFNRTKIQEALVKIGANTNVDKFVGRIADKANKRREEAAREALRRTGVDDAYIKAYMNAKKHTAYSDVNVANLTNKKNKDMVIARGRANVAPRGFFGGKQKPKLVYIANEKYNEALNAIEQAKAQKENAELRAQEAKENAARKAQEAKENAARKAQEAKENAARKAQEAREAAKETLNSANNLTNDERKRIMKQWRPGFNVNKAVNAVRAKKREAEALETNRKEANQALRNMENLTNAERESIMKKWKPGYNAMAQAQKIVAAKKADEEALAAMNITNNERANIMRRWKYGSWTFDARKEGRKLISEKEKKHIKNLQATVGGRTSRAGQWKEKDIRRVAQKLGKDVRALTINDLREANAEEKQALSNAQAAKNANKKAREQTMKNAGNERVLTERATAIRNKIIRTPNLTNTQKNKLVDEIRKNLAKPKRARKWLDDAEIDKRLAKLRSDAKARELAQRLGVREKFVRDTADRVGKPVYNLTPANITTQKKADPEIVANKVARNAAKQKERNELVGKKRQEAKRELTRMAERGLVNKANIPKAIATVTANTDLKVFIKQFERKPVAKNTTKDTASKNREWQQRWKNTQEKRQQEAKKQKAQEEANRLKAEKAERVKKAQEEANRLKAEKEAREKKAREDAEKSKAERLAAIDKIFERTRVQFNIQEPKFIRMLESDRKKYKRSTKQTPQEIESAITKKWQGIKERERARQEAAEAAAKKKAEEERIAAEKRQKEQEAAAKKKAERERIAAEKRKREQEAAAKKKAERERIAAEKRKREQAATKIQAAARGMRNRKMIKREAAATKIQAGARGMRNRKMMKKRQTAATKIQAGARGMRTRKTLKKGKVKRMVMSMEERLR